MVVFGFVLSVGALYVLSQIRAVASSGLASCLQPLDRLTRGDDRDALEAAHRQEVALVARGDEIGLAGDGRSDNVIVIGIGGHHARHVGR